MSADRMASCLVKGCAGARILHPFPRNLAMIKVWLRQTRQDFGDLNAFSQRVLVMAPAGLYYMCSRHFSPECYVAAGGSRKILKEDAVPTVFARSAPRRPNLAKVQVKEEEFPVSLSPSSGGFTAPRLRPSVRDASSASSPEWGEEMLGESILKCFVTGCPNGTEDQPLCPGVLLHTFPTDLAQVKLWLRQTGQRFGNLDLYARHILSKWCNFRICSSHFSPDSYLIHGGCATELRLDAVPTIFPKFESPVKDEDDKGFCFADAFAAPFRARGETEESVDEKLGVRHVGIGFDPAWGVRSVGVLTRPILVKEASTSVTRAGKNAKCIKLQKATAEKGVQCSTFEFSFDGDKRHARSDYFYQAGPFPPPAELGVRDPVFSLPSQWSEGGVRVNGATQEDYGSNEGVPVRDSRLFLALEDVLISLMQHLVSSPFIDESSKLTTHRILRQALQLICMLTGDKWMIAEREDAFENPDEVPVKCGDVGVYFSPDEWDYVESHKNIYMDIIPEDPLLTESQQDMVLGGESESEDEAKSSKHQNSPEWKPQSDRSEASESELSTEENADDSGDSAKQKPEDEFWNNPDLKIEQSEDGKSKIFWCVKCEVPIKDRQSFRCHLKTQRHLNYRADEEEVTCEECGQVFAARSALTKHKAENHATKRYACTICGLEYDYISQFIIHQRAHTGEKPFECDQCGKRFGHKCSLLVHHRRHVKGKTVKCGKCDKLFDTKSQLSKHERVHAPKKPFKCCVCGKEFERKRFFTKHMSEHGVKVTSDFEEAEEVKSNLEGAEEAKSNVKGSEEAKSNVKGSEEAKSNVKGSEEAKSNVKGSEEAKSNVKGSEEAKSNVKGSEEAESNLKGSEEARSYLKGSEEARSYLKGSEEAMSNLEGSEEARSYLKGSEEAKSILEANNDLEMVVDSGPPSSSPKEAPEDACV